MKALHDSGKIEYREPFGAVNCGDKVILRVRVEEGFSGLVETRLWVENQEKVFRMLKMPENIFEIHLIMPAKPGLVWYYFIIHSEGNRTYIGNNENHLGGIGIYYNTQPPSFQITVSDDFFVPKWIQNRIMYQIFPDSFCNGNEDGKVNSPKKGAYIQSSWKNSPAYHKNAEGRIIQWGFFGGNLKGITSKLDYLEKLGVGVIYLNPIFEAASTHRYDTGDYMKIDGILGTLADFDELILEAKKRDIAIILDGVFNHTGADSKYFNKKGMYNIIGAYNSPDSFYYNWYSFKKYPESYESWWDVDDLPNVNEMEESYQNFIYKADDSVIRYWLRRGVMGFRLDVADELPEDFIRGIRKTLEEENPDAFLIGEVWEDASNKVSYGQLRNYFSGDQLHSVMNYPFYNAFIDFANKKTGAFKLREIMMSIYQNYPKEAIFSAMNLIGSHDRARILTRLNTGSREQAIKRLKMISALQMALPGIPSIYYGDEVGMEGASDPFNRAAYPWGDGDASILEWYHKITRIRKKRLAEMLWQLPEIDVEGEDLFVLHFNNDEKEMHVVSNNSDSTARNIKFRNNFGEWAKAGELLYRVKVEKVDMENFMVSIPPLTTYIVFVTLSQ